MKKILTAIILLIGFSTFLGAQEKVRLLFDPQELRVMPGDVTFEYSPDSRVMKATYSYYYFIKADFLKTLGGKVPKEPFWGEILLTKVDKSTYKPGPGMPAPNGGFQRIEYKAKLVKDLTPMIKIMDIDLSRLEKGPENGTLQYSPNSMVMRASYDIYVFDEQALKESYSGELEGLREGVRVLVLETKEKVANTGKGAAPSGGIRLIYHKSEVLEWY